MQVKRKYSAKREAILAALKNTKIHPGAQWVYDRLKPSIPNLSLGTVYRNLSLFRQEGAAVSLGTVNGEERFDSITEPHPHLVCICCGMVLDMPGECVIRGCADIQAGEYEAFSIDFRKTVFYGLCSVCKNCGRDDEKTSA